ncbi:hypothetical protein QUA81_33570 [Microcoleus sp. F6_B4]
MTKPVSDDCRCGRSQLFTFKAKETVTVDRATLERTLSLLNECSNHLEYLSNNAIFVSATKKYLESLDTGKSRKALNLLSLWTDTWPDGSDDLASALSKAIKSIKTILAASQLGGGND